VTPGSAGAYEVDEGNSSDLTDLDALIAAANQTAGDWSDGMGSVADLQEMTRMWAVEKYVGHWDGYAGDNDPTHNLPNNYFLHSDAAGKFGMLPWGTDQTWAQHLAFDGPVSGILFGRCLADTSCAAMYRGAVQELRSAIPGLDLDKLAADTAAVLEPWQQQEQTASTREEYSTQQVADAVSSARAFIAARPGEADAWLNPPPGDPPPVTHGTSPPPASPLIGPAGSGPPPSGSTLTALRFGRLRFAGGVITTQLELPAPGRTSQRAISIVRGHIRTACLTRAVRTVAGVVTLRCRLSPAALRLLRSGSLKLTLRNWFIPTRGRAELVLRRLTVPRQANP
jgi:hypothetical protein